MVLFVVKNKDKIVDFTISISFFNEIIIVLKNQNQKLSFSQIKYSLLILGHLEQKLSHTSFIIYININ